MNNLKASDLCKILLIAKFNDDMCLHLSLCPELNHSCLVQQTVPIMACWSNQQFVDFTARTNRLVKVLNTLGLLTGF